MKIGRTRCRGPRLRTRVTHRVVLPKGRRKELRCRRRVKDHILLRFPSCTYRMSLRRVRVMSIILSGGARWSLTLGLVARRRRKVIALSFLSCRSPRITLRLTKSRGRLLRTPGRLYGRVRSVHRFMKCGRRRFRLMSLAWVGRGRWCGSRQRYTLMARRALCRMMRLSRRYGTRVLVPLVVRLVFWCRLRCISLPKMARNRVSFGRTLVPCRVRNLGRRI